MAIGPKILRVQQNVYEVGKDYTPHAFSVCEETECHPGLYLWPTKGRARDWCENGPYLKVTSRKEDVHQAGNKWRTRGFLVLGEFN